ncbi:MAG: hypothetical protein HPY71_12965 [Firmicutes bacterium]|nr:hypothetical protein [Bacillota bacterium]
MRKKVLILAIFASALVIAVLSGYYLLERGVLGERVRLAAAAELERNLGVEMKIDRVTLGAPGVARMSGVRVRMKNAPYGAYRSADLLSSPEVVVNYNPLGILMRKASVASSIKRITVVRPRVVLAKDADGHWNLGDLLAGKTLENDGLSQFTGDLEIVDGQVTVTGLGGPGSREIFTGVNGCLSLAKDGLVTGTMKLGTVKPGKGGDGRITADGWFNYRDRSYSLKIRADALPAGYAGSRGKSVSLGDFKLPEDVWVSNAPEALMGFLKILKEFSAEATGDIEFNGVAGSQPSVKGKISITKGILDLSKIYPGVDALSGEVEGEVDFEEATGGAPVYSGKLTLKRVRVELRNMPGGLVSFGGDLSGNVEFKSEGPKDLAIKGKIALGKGDIVAREVYKDIRSLSGGVNGEIDFDGKVPVALLAAGGSAGPEMAGKPAASGPEFVGGIEALLKEVNYSGRFSIAGGHVDIGAIIPGIDGISGPLDGQVAFQGKRGDKPGYRGVLRMSGAKVRAGDSGSGLKLVDGPVDGEINFEGMFGSAPRYWGKINLKKARIELGKAGAGGAGSRRGEGAPEAAPEMPATLEGQFEFKGGLAGAGALVASGASSQETRPGGSGSGAGGGGLEINIVQARAVIDGSEVTISGRIWPGRNTRVDLSVTAPGFNIAGLNRLGLLSSRSLPAPLAMLSGSGASGKAAVNLRVRGYGGAFSCDGTVALAGGSFRLKSLAAPIEKVEARVRFSGDSINIASLEGMLGGARVKALGAIRNLNDPDLDLKLSADGLDVATVAGLVKQGKGKFAVSGRGALEATIKGRVDAPFIVGEASFDRLAIGEASLQRAKVAFRYGNGSIMVKELYGSIGGGAISGDGVLALAAGPLAPAGSVGSKAPGFRAARAGNSLFSLKARDVDLAALGALVSGSGVAPGLDAGHLGLSGLSGRLTGSLIVKSAGDSYRATGSFDIASGSVGQYPFDHVEVDTRFTREGIAFDRLVLQCGKTDIHARGQVRLAARSVDISLSGQDIDLKGLMGLFVPGQGWLAGSADFVGALAGRFGGVRLEGIIDARDGTVYGEKYQSLRGRVAVSKESLHMNGISIKDGPASYNLTGVVGFGAGPVDVSMKVTHADVRQLLRLSRIEADITGTVSGALHMSGAPGKLSTEGALTLAPGTIQGWKVDRADLSFSTDSEGFKIRGFEARCGGSQVVASGRIRSGPGNNKAKGGGPGGGASLDLTVDAKGLRLEDIYRASEKQLAIGAIVDFKGKVGGTLANPAMKGEFEARDITLEAASFVSARGIIAIQDGACTFSPMTVKDGRGELVVTGKAGLEKDSPLSLDIDAKRVRLKNIVSALGPARVAGIADMDGEASGTIRISGTLSRPSFSLKVTLDAARIGEANIGRVTANISGEDGKVILKSLLVAQGRGTLGASGMFVPGKDIALVAEARRFDLSALGEFFNLRHRLTGSADLTVNVSGSPGSPMVTCTGEVANWGFDRLYFDRLEGTLRFRNGVVALERVVASQGQHRLNVYGSVPVPYKYLAALGLGGGPGRGGRGGARTQDLDLYIDMPAANLSLLGLLSDQIEWAEGSGAVGLHLVGALDSPRIKGAVRIAGGSIKLAPLQDAVTALKGGIVFEGDRARIDRITGSTRGGEFALGGEIGLKDLRQPDLDLWLKSNALRIATGQLDAIVDADLTVRGPAGRAVVKGTVKVPRARIGLGGWSLAGGAPFDTRLDVGITTGNDVRLVANGIDVELHGSLKATGTLRKPALVGQVESRRGTFAYLGTEFRLTEAYAEFTEFQGIEPSVDVRAETVVDATRIYLALKGGPGAIQTDLTSSPPMSQSEILAMLNYPGAVARLARGDVEGVMKDEAMRLIDQQLRLQVVGGIENMFRNALSLDEFRLERSKEQQLTLKLGKYVIDNLYLSYSTTLGPVQHDVLRFEYLQGRHIIFNGQLEDEGRYSLGVEARFRF